MAWRDNTGATADGAYPGRRQDKSPCRDPLYKTMQEDLHQGWREDDSNPATPCQDKSTQVD